ncbi:LuxR C-terminal-related transcriptional regulator [Lentzea sp. NPDC051208]|uniref:helix-turn-helix transcriptional regulator n=1 Tax=Lentzea sp. NPDC051208 TaxID=3154642 RepID=UPI003445E340
MSWLASEPGITTTSDADCPAAEVHVAVASLVDQTFLAQLGAGARREGAVVVLVLDNMPDTAVSKAVRARVVSLVPRAAMNRDRLVDEVINTAEARERGERVNAEMLADALCLARSAVPDRPLPALDDQDGELLRLLSLGWNSEEIARQISVSPRTVTARVDQVLRKCGARNRCEAIARAALAGVP